MGEATCWRWFGWGGLEFGVKNCKFGACVLGSPQGGGARFQNGGAVPASKMAAACPPSKWPPCPQAGQEEKMAAPPAPLTKGLSGRVGRDGCFLPFCLRKALLKMAPWGGGMRPWCSSWVRAAIATVMGPLRMHPPKQTKKNKQNHTYGAILQLLQAPKSKYVS